MDVWPSGVAVRVVGGRLLPGGLVYWLLGWSYLASQFI